MLIEGIIKKDPKFKKCAESENETEMENVIQKR